MSEGNSHDESTAATKRRPPEIAYSWPAIIFALTFPAIFVWKPLAWACLIGAFVCCPIRDAILDRFWPERP